MKALKRILLVLLIIIVLVIIVGFFLPRHVHVERSMTMKAHPGLVFNQVNIVKNWENWSPWHKLDTAMKLTNSGPTMGKGAAYAWDSKVKDVGKGKLTILSDKPYDTVYVSMEFMEDVPASSHFIFDKADEGAKVTWTFDADMGINPFRRYFGLFMDGILGKYFVKGLENIKQIVEANPNAMMKVEPGTINDIPYLYIRDMVTMENIGKKMEESYGAIMKFTQAKGITVTGPPFSISYSWANNNFDMADAFPVATVVPGEGRIQSATLKAGNVLKCDYYGAYEGTGLPYAVIEAWIKANNKKVNGHAWEEYLTDSKIEKNPEKWLTRVYWPVE